MTIVVLCNSPYPFSEWLQLHTVLLTEIRRQRGCDVRAQKLPVTIAVTTNSVMYS